MVSVASHAPLAVYVDGVRIMDLEVPQRGVSANYPLDVQWDLWPTDDVLVVAPCEGSIDDCEHLIPWVLDKVVTDIALTDRRIEVNWYVDA